MMKLYIEDIRLRDNGGTAPVLDGCIYVSVAQTYFPSYRWFDLVSADLENWIPKLLSFAKGHSDSCSLPFLDGPYQIRLNRSQSGEVSVLCLEDNRVMIANQHVEFSAFLLSCSKAAGRLATEIYQADGSNQFENQISKLGQISKELRLLATL